MFKWSEQHRYLFIEHAVYCYLYTIISHFHKVATRVTIQLLLHCYWYLYVQFVEVVAMEMGGVLMDVANASLAFKQMITVVSGMY